MTQSSSLPPAASPSPPLKKLNYETPDCQLLADALDQGIVSTDLAGFCTFANNRAAQLLGYAHASQLLGKNLLTLFPPADQAAPAADSASGLHRALEFPEKIYAENFLISTFNSTPLSIDLIGHPLFKNNSRIGTVLTFTEASSSRSAEITRKVFAAVEHAADPVMMTDRHGYIEYVNPAFEQVTGHNAQDVLGKRPGLLRSGVQDEEFYQKMWTTITGGETFRGVFVNRKKDGSIYYLEQAITPLKDDQGEITHFISLAKDISDRIAAEDRFWRLAHYDALTGLANRSLFRERLDQTVAHAQRHDELAAIIFLDLDGFKTINDSLGHSIGDHVLKAVSERIVAMARVEDTVARLNGDEFALIMIDIIDKNRVATIARKMLDAFTEPFIIANQEFFLTVSIGIAVYPFDGELTDDLVRAAETAMYRAKEEGRNSFRFFTADMTTPVVQRLALETQLRRALQYNEFFLEYQPLVNTSTGEMRSVEALLRWRHPQRGIVGPNEFIPVLEESGMINPVGHWVLKTACLLFAASNDPELNPVRFAINLSAHQFWRDNLIEMTERILNEAGTDPHRLVFEITESVLIKDAAETKAILTGLKDMGIQIAIDDFGTGYSSLGYLQRFPIDTLKIDRAFVVDLASKKESAALVKAIVAMADALGMNVVAEGVETLQQVELLQEYGCNIIQGYAISLPLPADKLKSVMGENYRFNVYN